MVSARLTGGGSGRKGRAAPDRAWSASQLLGRPRQQRRGALLGLAGECPHCRFVECTASTHVPPAYSSETSGCPSIHPFSPDATSLNPDETAIGHDVNSLQLVRATTKIPSSYRIIRMQ